MGLRVWMAGLCSVWLLAAGPARAEARDAAVAVQVPVPHGPVSVLVRCTISPAAASGAWIAAFAVDADSTGYVESSVTALGWWDHGRLDLVVRRDGIRIEAPPVEVVTVGERYRITMTATWGGGHRLWASTLRGGCGATEGTVTEISAILNGADVTASGVDARVLTAGARQFPRSVAAQGATLVHGSFAASSPYLLGVFSARSGALSVTAPDGSVRSDAGLYPSIPVRNGTGGTWRFDADTAVSDDPYLLTALAFAKR
ncbi:MAG TPA: hypothetical protein VM841_00845 [Actinomycetota bacterium]|nr:hypothetical protein [Actinomycetota bacterium]